MKHLLALMATSAIALSSASAAGLPVSFALSVDPASVALQFDVSGSTPVTSLGLPQFEGASGHAVKSATLASGVHRFVVYSLDNTPISAGGRVKITFDPTFPVEDGALTIGNVTASNAVGAVVDASTNALPALAEPMGAHRAIVAGGDFDLSGAVVDLDGALANLSLRVDGGEVDSAAAAPFAVSWGPIAAGTYTLSLLATDDSSASASIDLGTLRSYAAADITNYDSFATIFYGPNASGSTTGLTSDPFGTGVRNGLAYLLGLDPQAPDFAKLPTVAVERAGDGSELVVRFQRRSDIGSLVWRARESSNLSDFAAVDSEAIDESAPTDGFVAVEIRLPLDPAEATPRFVGVDVVSE